APRDGGGRGGGGRDPGGSGGGGAGSGAGGVLAGVVHHGDAAGGAVGAEAGGGDAGMNPFRIEGPAVISFSGGRTSGYLLRRIVDEGLSPDGHVLFGKTGEGGEGARVRVRGRERVPGGGYRETGFAGASRAGEPFAALIAERRYLPNPRARFCTQALKIDAFRWFMEGQGYPTWTNVVGFRADERRRVVSLRQREAEQPDAWTSVCPLAEA